MLNTLTEIVLSVQDMNLQVSFYRDVLGFQVKEPAAAHDFREFYVVILAAGSCTLKLSGGGSRRIGPDAPKMVFRVANIDAIRNEFFKRGLPIGEVLSPISGILACDGRDPEGNAFTLEAPSVVAYGTPSTATDTIGAAMPDETSIDANSRRGRIIIALRTNKLAILGEIACIVAAFYALEFIQASLVLPLLMLIVFLLWLRGGTLRDLGLVLPKRVVRTFFIGVGAAILLEILNIMILPLVIRVFGSPPDVHVFSPIQGNGMLLANALVSAWTSAAIGEEVICRGYLLNRFADLFGRSNAGWIIALVLQAIIFGTGHAYQGITGVFLTSIDGLFFGTLCLLNRRLLWPSIVAHGFIDTIAFLATFAS